LSWGKAGPAFIAVAIALVIIANAPAVLVDPLALAVAQIRANAAKTAPTAVVLETSETESPVATSVKKTK
jgi:hypothetical protein